MTTLLTDADLGFLFTQLLPESQGIAGVTDPFSILGLREIEGTNNNLTNVIIIDQYGNTVDTNTFATANQPFFNVSNAPLVDNTVDNNYTPLTNVVDSSPRTISNLIVDMSADNPSVPDDAFGNPSQPAFALPPTNALFTFFGQFFDHGLDFIDKDGPTGNSVLIEILPSDPLYDPTPGAFNFMPVSRATLDGGGETNNSTAPLVEQSQTYGQLDSTTFYLREYVDQGGAATPQTAIATGRLVTNADGGMATWADIQQNALNGAGITLNDVDVLDIPDPFTGLPTGQPLLADIAHAANPANAGYDSALLADHKVAGDGRANENTALTSIHAAFHSEHNRIVEMLTELNLQRQQVNPTFPTFSGEDLFQAAKLVNEMQYQHFAFEFFARRMSPNIDAFAQYDVTINPNISAEFSQAIYRLGHSMLTDSVRGVDAADNAADMSLVDAFLNPRAFDAVGAGALIEGQTRQQSNLIDEHVVDSLRNFLVGLSLDLAAINIARGRDVNNPTLNQLREQIFAETGETTLAPYTSWADFGAHMLHPDSLVNFIAAYETADATIAAAHAAGDNDAARARAAELMLDATFMNGTNPLVGQGFRLIDLWLGALAEEKATGPTGVLSQLGTTADFVFAQQMLALQNGDRLYYLSRLAGTNILDEIEASTFGDLFERGTGARHTNGDIFSTADEYVELFPMGNGVVWTTAGIGDWHEVIGGTTGVDTISTGAGNDTIWGEAGDDTLNGGIGDDQINGGDGDDTISGGEGVDFLRGGAGDDTINGDAGDDLIFGQAGNDTINGGNDVDEVFGGFGDDRIDGGAQDDTLFGQENDDVLIGGAGNDALDGGAHNDHLSGGIGDDTLIGGTGVNVLVGGAGADVLDGTFGEYDVALYSDSSVGLTIDLTGVASTGDAIGDTYLLIEEVGGTPFSDQIFGDAAPNILSGRGGGDVIDGFGGADVLYDNIGEADILIGGALGDNIIDQAVFLGRAYDNSLIVNNADGTVSITENLGAGVTDTLTSIEEYAFDDGIFNTVANTFVPLLGIAANLGNTDLEAVELLVNGVSVDPNFVNTTAVVDGDSLVGGGVVGGPGVEVGTVELFDRDGFNGLPAVALAGPDAVQFRLGAATISDLDDGTGTGGIPDGINDTLTQTIYFQGLVPGQGFANYEVQQVYNIAIDGADVDGGSGINFSLEIVDANDNAPVFTSPDNLYVGSGASADTVIYRATSSDRDTVGDPVTYSLPVGQADNNLFTMTNNGEVTFNAPPVFDTGTPANNLRTMQVRAFDGLNETLTTVAITIKPAPVFNTAGGTIPWAENSPAANVVYDAGATDSTGLPVNFVLSGPDAGRFTLDSLTGELRFRQSPDFETPLDVGGIPGDNVYEVTIGASNTLSTTPQAVSVEVTNVGGTVIVGTANNDVVMPNFSTLFPGQPLPTIDGDTISGLAGIDVLDGGPGNDRIEGGAGDDSINGGSGVDTAAFIGPIQNFEVTAFNDDGSIVYTDVTSGLGSDTLSSIERIHNGGNNLWEVQLGTSGADTLTSAMDMWDIMNGGAGDDIITGGAGNDILGGGADSDVIDGGDGTDTVSSLGPTQNFAVTAFNDNGSIVYTDVTGVLGSDTLSNIERIHNGGNNLWEVQLGTVDADTLTSATGAWDIMNGGAGNDTITGGIGNDILGGGSGLDSITGGTGLDTIEGGAHSDTLTGGGDADTFVFASALSASNVDTITDFAVGSDVISLDRKVFTALSAPPDLTAAEFVIGSGATAGDAADRIIYDTDDGALYYDQDGVGGVDQQQFAVVLESALPVPTLSETDFVIV